MKTRLSIITAATLLVLVLNVCAQELGRPTRIEVQVFVHDSDGKPVEGAKVHLSLPRYGPGEMDENANAGTNVDGMATVAGVAHTAYRVWVDKAGYYHTEGPKRSIDTEPSFKRFAIGVQKIDLEMCPIRNPTRGISKFVDHVRIPAVDVPMGFDLEIGDWVAPYGRGTTSDFIFTLTGRYKEMTDYDQTLTLTFGNAGDGIILTKFSPEIGPVFKFPYEAPLTGYESKRTWRTSATGQRSFSECDNSGQTHYILRVRTQLDESGHVRRALYGATLSEINLGGNNQIGRSVSFVYQLNPDWTRNIEFDSEKEVRAGTGKLLVQPPPRQ